MGNAMCDVRRAFGTDGTYAIDHRDLKTERDICNFIRWHEHIALRAMMHRFFVDLTTKQHTVTVPKLSSSLLSN